MTSYQSPMAGLYIHIPFCKSKCLYCDFYSITDLAKAGSFLAALEREMELVGHTMLTFDTLYIGGGTPSVLNPAAIEQIIVGAFKHFNIRSNAEVTLEANPGTITLEDLCRYRQAGVNRLNIGIQSFQDKSLKFLGRIHSRADALASLDRARRAGFGNIGLDLIYGLPQQDKDSWICELDQAVQFNPEHLSCYMLTRESGTPLDREVIAGHIHLPADDNLRSLFETTHEYLANNGFHHYEVSNFARRTDDDCSTRKSRHNLKYWSFAPYIGLGPSAHSYLEPQRHWNHRSVEKYIEKLGQDNLPIAEKEQLTREQMILESIYLGFRTAKGIDLDNFKRRFELDFVEIFRETIADFENDELLQVTKSHCRLTSKGMVILDGITARFTSQDMPDDSF